MKNKNFIKIRNFIFEVLAFGAAYTIVSYLMSRNLTRSVVLGVAGGVIFAVLLTAVTHILQSRMLKNGPQGYRHTEAANRVVGAESVGGRIYLFDDHLEFHAHSFNLSKEALHIPYADIREITYAGFPGKVHLMLSSGSTTFIVESGREFADRLTEYVFHKTL